MSEQDPAEDESQNTRNRDPKTKTKFVNFHICLLLLIKKNPAVRYCDDSALLQCLHERLGLLNYLLILLDLRVGLGKLVLELLFTLLVLLLAVLVLRNQILQLSDLVALLGCV